MYHRGPPLLTLIIRSRYCYPTAVFSSMLLSGISGYHIQMFRCHRQTAASGCEILVAMTGEAFDLSVGSPGTEITLIKRLQNQLTGPLGGST